MPEPAPVLTPQDLSAIRSTFALATRPGNTTGARFYEVLFRLDPSLRALFHGDLQSQAEKLISLLTLVVSNLGNLEQLGPTLRQLGQRHTGYGVKEAHYATVGVALIQTLSIESGNAWSTDADSAWKKAYRFLAETMLLRRG